MTIQTIYDHYHIPPNLQRHMYQVTAVGQYLVDHWRGRVVDKSLITQVLLLHDMGNIIKFHRPFLGELEQDAEFWETVQEQFIQRYGYHVHPATLEIATEVLGEKSPVLKILDTMGFFKLEADGFQSDEARICDHADMLVSPLGIVNFSKREQDLIVRYQLTGEEKGIRLRRINAKFIQEHVDVDLEKVGEVDFSKQIEALQKYKLL